MGTLLNVPASISKQPELLLKNLMKQVQNDGMGSAKHAFDPRMMGMGLG